MICSQCCTRPQSKCQICTLSISHIRRLVLESIVESNRISCPYARFRYRETLTYNGKQTHTEFCQYAPCFCPVPACRFKGSAQMLLSHLNTEHRSAPFISFTYGYSFEVELQRQQSFCILIAYESDLITYFFSLTNMS